MSERDVVIVGAGPIGAALALLLARVGHRATLVEAREQLLAADDTRTLALSAGTRLILERIGVWHALPVIAIETIHVSQRGGFGRSVLHAADNNLEALGYVTSYAALQVALRNALRSEPRIEVLTGKAAVDVETDADFARLDLADATAPLSARLVVIADGGASTGQFAEVTERDYGQHALTASVSTSTPAGGIAYERFTPSGPLALLPTATGFALIWTLPPADAQLLGEIDDAEFLARLQTAFGWRAGLFTAVSARSTFPLRLRVARRTPLDRALLLGNAAQTLHPVAGQGFNLGLRDAWELAACIEAAHSDPGSAQVLESYMRTRERDRAASIFLTDVLVRVFGNDLVSLRWLRGFGLVLLDNAPLAKRSFIQQMTFGRAY